MGLFDFGFNFSKGGGIDIGSSKELMQFQSDQWRGNTRWFNENGYKFLRQGLINADYNPILAIGASPLNGEMPNVTAQQGTESFGFNATPSANMQANTAKKISESAIALNNANAEKASEEALTQSNYRANLDSQTALNNIETIWKNESMPFQLKLLETQVELNKYMSANYSANTAKTNEEKKYVKTYADAAETTARANETNAETNKNWTPAKIVAGIVTGGLAATGLGKLGRIGKGSKYLKGAAGTLGKNGYKSSSAKYFTTVH